MALNAPDLNRSKKRNSQNQGRCPVCGRRQITRPSRHHSFSDDGMADDLEQLVETMNLGEIAALLGITRYELVKRYRSIGIPVDGIGEEDE